MMPFDATTLLAVALACYGLSFTIVEKDGPFDLLLRLRTRLGAYDLAENGLPERSAGRFITCPFCVGVWIGLVLVVMPPSSVGALFIFWWAVVGGQFFLERLVRQRG